MGSIIRLDEQLSNMIAAGEVVERPANVVKELVENAIDASSTAIEIELKEAGLDSIRITDNGVGMDKTDALLAFERHATSKIKSQYDLFHIHSLGFRGEALPSIAAIARMELTTSTGDKEGFQVVYQSGKLVSSGVASARKGTSILVTKLFYNTPARLKYMKGPNSELAVITEFVDKIALAHPEIAFSFSNNGKIVLRTPGTGNIIEVLGHIYGFSVAKEMRSFNNSHRDYHLQGVIANPLVNRSAKSYITLIANGRIIKNPRVIGTVIDAFDQRIPKGRYPIALVKIDCDPLLIDVNIHPTKQEIKFSEEAKLSSLLTDILKKTIAQFTMIQESDKGAYAKTTDTSEETPYVQPDLRFEEPEPSRDSAFEEPIMPTEPAYQEPMVSTPNKEVLPEMSYIGQYAGTYLLFQNSEGLFLMDQHAAAERIRYERYSKKMGEPNPEYYDLLVPFNLDFSNHEAIQIEAHLSELKDFGITLTLSGSQSFFINSVPVWFPHGFEELYVEEVIRTLLEGKNPSIASVRDELAKRLACKHSIKANHYLNEGEVKTLVHDLKECINPYTCPHGRPVVVRLPLLDIEKWFRRVM